MWLGPVMLDFVYKLVRFDLYDRLLMSNVLIYGNLFASFSVTQT